MSGWVNARLISSAVTIAQRAVAIGFRGREGDAVSAGTQHRTKTDVREHVSVGADGCQDDVHAVGS